MKRKNLLALLVFLGGLTVIDLPRLMSSSCPAYPPVASCGNPLTVPDQYGCSTTTHPCTCGASGCHGGTPITSTTSTLLILLQDSATYIQTGQIADTLNASFKYTPGTTYYMDFQLLSNTGIYGFEMTALNMTAVDTTMAGNFTVITASNTFKQIDSSNFQYISHHNASDNLNWLYKWTSPVTTTPVTFYYTYNLSDSNALYIQGLPEGTIYEGNTTIQSTVSGINDISNKVSNIEIFPNPTSDQFNLSFTLKQSEPISLNVYSVDGKMVQQLMQNETRGEGYFNSSFDISNLAAGIYLAKLSVGDASITKKITKL